MKVLGKVAFIPVIASGMIAAGAGAGVAMAATAPAIVHGNAVTPDTTRTATASTNMYQSVDNGAVVGQVKTGDTLNCTASQQSTSGKTFFHCTDTANNVSGWIWQGNTQ